MITDDLEFVKKHIAWGYYVSEDNKKCSIRCYVYDDWAKSGMDETYWAAFKTKCETFFGKRLLEFYHEVNHRHKDFIIYLIPSNQK